jgi:glycerol-3-phosphate dehydrogenase
MGRCQGGYCTTRVMRILSRETGIPFEKITKSGGNSYIAGYKMQ